MVQRNCCIWLLYHSTRPVWQSRWINSEAYTYVGLFMCASRNPNKQKTSETMVWSWILEKVVCTGVLARSCHWASEEFLSSSVKREITSSMSFLHSVAGHTDWNSKHHIYVILFPIEKLTKWVRKVRTFRCSCFHVWIVYWLQCSLVNQLKKQEIDLLLSLLQSGAAVLLLCWEGAAGSWVQLYQCSSCSVHLMQECCPGCLQVFFKDFLLGKICPNPVEWGTSVTAFLCISLFLQRKR